MYDAMIHLIAKLYPWKFRKYVSSSMKLVLVSIKIEVVDLAKRVNFTILAIFIVDSWHLYKSQVGGSNCMSHFEYYFELSQQPIENIWNGIRRRSMSNKRSKDRNIVTKLGTGIHLVITTRKRMDKKKKTKYAYQGWSSICSKRKCTSVCSECLTHTNRDIFVCNKDGTSCCNEHVRKHHDVEV